MSALLLVTLLATAQAPLDPRIELVEAQTPGRDLRVALEQVQSIQDERPTWATDVGLPYLEGRLLSRLGRTQDALQVFIRAARESSDFQADALLEVARGQIELGHPEVAAGVLSALLRSSAGDEQSREASALMVASLAQGADCGVLKRVPIDTLESTSRRRLELARIDCRLVDRSGEKSILLDLLADEGRDLVAQEAANRLHSSWNAGLDRDARTLLGETFHQHRDFGRAVTYLEPAVSRLPQSLDRDEFDLYYRYVRAYFWQGDFARAETGYADLAARASRSDDRARALYNRSRSLEFLGRWQEAAADYRRAFLADPLGNLSGSAMLAALRLEWRRGREADADDLLERLPSDRRWRAELSRARLFLAASDIVRERNDRAGYWLKRAETAGTDRLEVDYWSGRLAELDQKPAEAVGRYLSVLQSDPYHLLGASALRRLRSPQLASTTAPIVERAALGDHARDLASAARVLDPDQPATTVAGVRLRERLQSSRAATTMIDLELVGVSDWPLWQQDLATPAERMLGLGLWSEGEAAIRTHFPIEVPALAYTAAEGLSREERPHRSIYIAEVLFKKVPRDVPDWLLPAPFRRLMFPAPWSDLIERETTAADVDPFLLLAILREESRFDRRAASPASARGLAQFIYPTAVEIAEQIGLDDFESADLERPEIAIRLAAAYLAKLDGDFEPNAAAMVAAYNAGERQVQLWQALCFSNEPEEFYTKVGFMETRNYVGKVIRSRNQYREIYGSSQRP